MSVAFQNEDTAEMAREISLERRVSPFPNVVTEAGVRALEQGEEQARHAVEAARRVEDTNERRRAIEHAERDLLYFHDRLMSAEVRRYPQSPDAVVFGAQVTYLRDSERRATYRIVGEDEADPRQGTISYVAPLAKALMGKRVGDVVEVGGHAIEILAIA
ncbi:MAG: transcription elongation factor GreA [Roseiarcus sp.]